MTHAVPTIKAQERVPAELYVSICHFPVEIVEEPFAPFVPWVNRPFTEARVCVVEPIESDAGCVPSMVRTELVEVANVVGEEVERKNDVPKALKFHGELVREPSVRVSCGRVDVEIVSAHCGVEVPMPIPLFVQLVTWFVFTTIPIPAAAKPFAFIPVLVSALLGSSCGVVRLLEPRCIICGPFVLESM